MNWDKFEINLYIHRGAFFVGNIKYFCCNKCEKLADVCQFVILLTTVLFYLKKKLNVKSVRERWEKTTWMVIFKLKYSVNKHLIYIFNGFDRIRMHLSI